MSAKEEAQRDMDDTIARFGDGHETLGNALISAHAYAAAAVAEARAPLVEALEAAYRQITGYPSTEGGGVVSGYGQDKNNPLPRKIAAALAEETPDA